MNDNKITLAPIDLPNFYLNGTLQSNLPQSVINRCSTYFVFMKFNDNLNRTCQEEEKKFLYSNLHLDDGKFLSLIACGYEIDESFTSSPYTIHQICNTSTTTQLWKPKTSWWEAKSKRNPWIDPRHHYLRWSYLSPLIQYHRFLTKQIKKQDSYKNKDSVCPLCTFLIEEIRAVSFHLARVSSFTSEEWTKGLLDFSSWKHIEASNNEMKVIIKSCLIPAKFPKGTIEDDVETSIDKCLELTYQYINQSHLRPRNFVDTSFDVHQNTYISEPRPIMPQHILPNPYTFHHVYVADYYNHSSLYNHYFGYPSV